MSYNVFMISRAFVFLSLLIEVPKKKQKTNAENSNVYLYLS